MGRGLGPGFGGMVWCYVYASPDALCRWQFQVSIYYVYYVTGYYRYINTLLLLHVCMLRECEGNGNAGVGGEGVCSACGWYTWFRYCVQRS